MSWFYDTFLPSLLERAGTNKGMWLSRKQTAACIDKMELHTVMVPQFQRDYCRHNYYTLEWNGRHIHLDYSKLNGCGMITFGLTVAEAEQAAREREEEKQREKAEEMERRRAWVVWARENAPERLAQRIARHQAEVAKLHKKQEDNRQNQSEAEAEGDAEWVTNCIAYATELAQKLAEAEAMLAIYL